MRDSLIASTVTRGVEPSAPLRPINEDWIDSVPTHWKVCRIKRVVARIDYGISEKTAQEGQFPVLKMGHIQRGEIRFTNLDFVESVSADLLLQTGDILYNRTNSPDQVGKAAIFRKSRDCAVTFASYLVRIRTNHRANPYYLELGGGFAFVARQKRITLDGVDYYMDLLFYHRHLRRLVVIELKLGDFRPADLGQIELYLRWLDRHERAAGEEPPIGLILCAGKKDETVEYLGLDRAGVRIAEYLTELPERKILKQKLHDAVRLARARLEQPEN